MTIKFNGKVKTLENDHITEGKWSNMFASALVAGSLLSDVQAKNKVNNVTTPIAQKTTINTVKTNSNNVKNSINTIVPKLVSTNSVITTNFIERLVKQESKFNPKAIGDRGKAKGLLQLHVGAWVDTVKKHLSPKLYSYFKNSFDINKNLTVGILYLKDLENSIKYKIIDQKIKQGEQITPAMAKDFKPSEEQLYAAWNAGLTNLIRHNFDVEKLAEANPQFRENLETFRSNKT